MKEIYRDDTFLAVELPERTRTFQFFRDSTDAELGGRALSRSYRLPETLAVVCLDSLFMLGKADGCWAPFNFPGLESKSGKICLGSGLRNPDSLDDALSYYLDEFYQRPFVGYPTKRLVSFDRLQFPDVLFFAAFENRIDARPYREHRYFETSDHLLQESEAKYVAFSRWSRHWTDEKRFSHIHHLYQIVREYP